MSLSHPHAHSLESIMNMRRSITLFLTSIFAAWFAVANAAAAEGVLFDTDVMAVLSKAGCNMGVCHGNQNGKGGFKLSLRGENPEADFAVMTRDLSGRRANSVEPEQSLLLLKPLMQVPHEGGQR